MAADDIELYENVDIEVLVAAALCGGSEQHALSEAVVGAAIIRHACTQVECCDCPFELDNGQLSNPKMFKEFMQLNRDKFILKEE